MKPILAIQSKVPDTVTQSLDNLAKAHLQSAEWEEYLASTPQLKCSDIISPNFYDLTRFSLDSTGAVTIRDGFSHHQNGSHVYLTNKDLVAAIALAFQAVYQDIERILNKDLKNADHQIVCLLRIYKATDISDAGPWHRDGVRDKYDVPVSSLIYFLHEGCQALFSMIDGNALGTESRPDQVKPFATIATKSGMSITFANDPLKHRVHDVKANSSVMAHRGLLTFFYAGPANVPPQISDLYYYSSEKLAIESEIESVNDDGSPQTTVYRLKG